MNAEQLSKVGSDLVRRCGTRDPFQIANALGINVMDDCENLGSLKGMYCIVKRNRFIFLRQTPVLLFFEFLNVCGSF